jgi:hypothetical protein
MTPLAQTALEAPDIHIDGAAGREPNVRIAAGLRFSSDRRRRS